MKKSIIKIITIVMIIGLNWTGLSAIGETFAYFSDTESSNSNLCQVGILDFELASPTNNFIPSNTVTSMMPGDSVTREISVVKESSSNPFQYRVQTVKISGDDDFCNALTLKAELEGVEKYNGSLMDLNFNPSIIINNSGQDDWLFTVTLPSGAGFFPNETCQIKFVFDGWQTNLSDSSLGFSDQEEIVSSFAASQGIKINKVYYDVDSEHGEDRKNEWVELYNPTDSAINLKNWEICDNNNCEVINPNVDIPAFGFALVSHDASTWQHYWDVPDDIVKIYQLGGSFVYLNNDADMLILKDSSGNIVDQMNWGEPDSSWDNYNSNLWDPGIPDVDDGHMLGRMPNGYDTDQSSDWKDLGLPDVTVVSPNGGETWYMVPDDWPQNDTEKAFCQAHGMNENCEYPIEWTATNPNGDNNDLLIDIYYSVNSGNSWILQIADDIGNDGTFGWKIPYNHAYITEKGRIKVVATWTENGMAQNWDMSDSDFCPPMLTIDDLLNWEEEMEAGNSIDASLGTGNEPDGQVDDNNANEDASEDTGTNEIGDNGQPDSQLSDNESSQDEATSSQDSTVSEQDNSNDESGGSGESVNDSSGSEKEVSDNQEDINGDEQNSPGVETEMPDDDSSLSLPDDKSNQLPGDNRENNNDTDQEDEGEDD